MSVTVNQLHTGAPVVKRVVADMTGTTAGNVWAPATGYKVRLRGIALRCRVTTVLAAATVGDLIYLCDNAGLVPLMSLGRIVAANDAAGTDYGHVYFTMPAGGYTLAAADNVLKVTTGATITTGVINCLGFVWGDEVK